MVITMELIAEIRRRHFVGGESISALSRSVGLSGLTERKHLLTTTPPVYSRAVKSGRRLGCFEDRLLGWLESEKRKPTRERPQRSVFTRDCEKKDMKALMTASSVMSDAGNVTISPVRRHGRRAESDA